jgi:UDP-4-amino-4,6-dideoxy-N-acetyl-beta-L-altrosamine transaminase
MNIGYGKQSITETDVEKVKEALWGSLSSGPQVSEFERHFANYAGARYAVAVSSGTAALHLICLALGISPGDRVLVPPITFAATANCARYCGADPVFADVSENGLLSVSAVEKCLEDNSIRLIIPVHYGGNTCDMSLLAEKAGERGIFIVEDACHALGAVYAGDKIGSCRFSDMCVFSFHPVKQLTTGEGGMITTNSPELYEKLCLFRSHGIIKEESLLKYGQEEPWHQEMHVLGYNYRISDINCALGISQLAKLEDNLQKRAILAGIYNAELKDIREITLPDRENTERQAWHLYCILLENREIRKKLYFFLREKGIYCQVHYVPVYWHPYYQALGYKEGLCPVAEDFYHRVLTIPLYPDLQEFEQQEIIGLIRDFFKTENEV